MDKNKIDLLSEEVLTQLEMKENHLLNWGFLGGSLDAIEKLEDVLYNPPTARIEELWEELHDTVSIEMIVENLHDRRLLFKTGEGYRTRFAETVRLLHLLKQRFSFKDWLSGRNLVSNIKGLLSYRKYPKRDQSWDVVMANVNSETNASDFVIHTLQILLGNGELKLSKFQIRSLLHLLNLTVYKDSGTIIGAGTGSGKTKAFYLPAFVKIVTSLKNDPSSWSRILGIYPRNELLKDQYKEALSEILKLNQFLKSNRIRPITIGSYFGDTPDKVEDVESHNYRAWEKNDDGYICPFFTCPNCGSAMVWHEADYQREKLDKNGNYERVICANEAPDHDCGLVVESENVVLTRKRMKKNPPDILFTTTEMLNRKISSAPEQHIFGIDSKYPPLYVLFDEVHIYEGVTGGHIGYVIRRWRNLVNYFSNKNRGIQFVGLSATLPNPETFFSQLVGISAKHSYYITPKDEELESEGVEYNLVVRGDPFSATALLSTSVQTAMLFGRMLDPIGMDVSKGAIGSKTFGFTDKLDVINRWYHIERDAEGKQVLSSFRDKKLLEKEAPHLGRTTVEQRRIGQLWDAAKLIDNKSLRNPLKLDITSSQQKGVDPLARLVIATSTLEVGFNDPEVGAVIQHKAPRNLASFMQRKGRAGRTRGMRPWTVIVASAYGRDRFVYDYPEQIYSPTLPELSLPIKNAYIQRIQAAFIVMDYLAIKLKESNRNVQIWNLMSRPKQKDYYYSDRRLLVHFIEDIINGTDSRFIPFVRDSLNISGAELDRVLWTPPRSIMMHVLPSIHAHLQTNWGATLTEFPTDSIIYDYPMHGYVPRNLFTSLEVHELQIIHPSGKKNYQGLQSGIREFAPGNVTKRYVNVNNTWEAHWINPGEGDQFDLADGPIKGVQLHTTETDQGNVSIFQPVNYELEQIPSDVTDRSSGFLQWELDLQTINQSDEQAKGLGLPLLPHSSLHDFFSNVNLFTVNENEYVRVTRYSPVVNLERKMRNGDTMRKDVSFLYHQEPAAIGFQVDVDAISFQLKDITFDDLTSLPNWDQLKIELRPYFYFHQLQEDDQLSSHLTYFEIEWLWQVCMSSVVAISISQQVSLEQAANQYRKSAVEVSKRTLHAIFNTTTVSTEVADQENEESKLVQRLLDHIQNEQIMEILMDQVSVLYDDLTTYNNFIPWVKERTIATLAASIQEAFSKLVPDVNTEDIHLDIIGSQIWFSEQESGGLGIIAAIASELQNSPSRFESFIHHSIQHCSRDDISRGLTEVTSLLSEDDMQDIFFDIRKIVTIDDQKEQLDVLQRKLVQYGITPKKELIVSMTSKLLYEGSSEKTDDLVATLHNLWKQEEVRLGCKIDSRVFTVACLRLENIREQLTEILMDLNGGMDIDEKQLFIFVESLLWSDCKDSCPECLTMYSPYQSFAKPSRILLQSYLQPNYRAVDATNEDWKEQVIASLQQGIHVRVICPFEKMNECQKELIYFIQNPIDYHFEMYHPYIHQVTNKGTEWYIDLSVREISHE
ncbi:DEAD/DEAH box helicase [Halobacillus sp. GSS1]|uniref:protein DpdJ n=1 Tax=Halobacillus sp. GSS1 TaxID=2815919 RepID=UPI001A8CEF97|nr:protein DpdJ [Halobacillus sp. GSS1]MBN9653282.1 DEAD/DEAH box helicase [Halobacillus sp. GSS1]